jgi:hypothetical protein
MSKALLKSVQDFLVVNGFHKDEYGFRSEREGISVDVYISRKPEADDYWEEDEVDAIGFFPKAQISMESRHSEASHVENYRLAKELAKIVCGVIYDHKVAVVYDSDGLPCGHCRTDGKLEDYGAGVEPFMEAVGKVRDVLNGK